MNLLRIIRLFHIVVLDPAILAEVKRVLEGTPGVGQVLDAAGQAAAGIKHIRSGDLIAIADGQSWFSYYWWTDDALAPDYARTVDIHRKPGYDPVELFVDPQVTLPALRVAWFLLKKKLGFKALLKLIPLDATLVRGSHGRIPEDPLDWPVLIAPASATLPAQMASTDVYARITKGF